MTELAILVPVLRRPHRVAPFLDSVDRATPQARVVFLPDPDDSEEIAAIREAVRTRPLDIAWLPTAGNYARKINRGVKATETPLIFLGADDIEFHEGWFEAAKECLSETVGVVGTNDLANKRVMAGLHSTHSLVARWYAELGKIDGPELLHEGYPHEFVDDEFVQTAVSRGAFDHAPDAIVEHLHPMVGKAPMDPIYERMRHRMRQGRRVFRERQALWQA